MMRKSLTLAGLVSLGMHCFAADQELNISRYRAELNAIRSETSASFHRQMAILDSSLNRPAINTVLPLSASSGFTPSHRNTVALSVTATSPITATGCVTITTSSLEDWGAAVQAIQAEKYEVTQAGCLSAASWPAPPAGIGQLYARFQLNAEDSLTATVIPPDPIFGGVGSTGFTVPGISLPRTGSGASAQATITITNPWVEIDPGPPVVGRTLALQEFYSTPGLSVSHNCAAIAPTATCAMTVQVQGTGRTTYIGRIRMAFTNGAVANIGVRSTRTN